MDELARALGLDPRRAAAAQLRRRRPEAGQALHRRPRACGVCYERATEALRLARPYQRPPRCRAPTRRGHRLRRPRLGRQRLPARLRLGQAQRRRHGRRRHRHPGHRHRHAHRPDPGRRRGAGPADGAHRPPPRRHGQRAVRPGQLRQRHPGDDRPGRARRRRRGEAASSWTPPRLSSRSRADAPARRGREHLRRGRQPSRPIAVAEVTGRIAPHMIQGHGARGPNPQRQVGPHLRRPVRRGRGRRRDRRGRPSCGSSPPTTAGGSSTRPWSTARSSAASPRGSASP